MKFEFKKFNADGRIDDDIGAADDDDVDTGIDIFDDDCGRNNPYGRTFEIGFKADGIDTLFVVPLKLMICGCE